MANESSNDPNVPAVRGENTANGDGLVGVGRRGVVGTSDTFQGVFGKSIDNAGVVGESDKLHGIFGVCHNPNGGGVFGTNDAGNGTGFGVIGTCDSNIGVAGDSKTGSGVRGVSQVADGVLGIGRRGVVGISDTFQGVFGKSIDNAGVVGESDKLHGIFGVCHNPNGGGVFGTNDKGGFGVIGVSEQGVGISGKGGQLAGRFEGDVEVTQILRVAGDVQLTGADLAEQFGIVGQLPAEPGSVVVLAGDDRVRISEEPYDHRVAGIVSGAGDYRPAIVLDRQRDGARCPLALTGKVWCKVDADFGPVDVGDMLTTSATPGHAMRAADPARAFGAVIGKALGTLQSGRALVLVLVCLQ